MKRTHVKMASLYVKYPKACRNKKSSVCMSPPASLTSSSTGSLSSNDGIKSSSPRISQSKRKQHVYHHAHIIRSPKVLLTLPKRKKLKRKKSPPSTTTTSSDSDTTHKLDKCRAFIINSNNNIHDEIDRNCCFDSTCKNKKNLLLIPLCDESSRHNHHVYLAFIWQRWRVCKIKSQCRWWFNRYLTSDESELTQ